MTTREIYFKCLMKSNLPIGLIGYVYKDKNNILQIGKTICVEFKTDEEIVNKYIQKMKEIEQRNGFTFWCDSIEGENFFKNNYNIFSKHLYTLILNQK